MAYHIFVSGRVQAVGYRRFAQKQAKALEIKGWTRNLADGRVEIFAAGSEKALDLLCEDLRKGPQFSLVHEVLVKKVEDGSEKDFKILSDEFEIHPDAEWK